MRIETEDKEDTGTDSDLVSFVMNRVDRYTDHRDSLYAERWDEYERLWRGIWSEEDKVRDSERSRLISPALQQAIETRQSEISEAVFGKGEFFDVVGDPETSIIVRNKLHESFKKDKIRKSIEHIVLMAEVFGTGIGEIVEIDRMANEYPAGRVAPKITWRLTKQVVELNGSRDKGNIAKFVDQMPISDSKHIRNFLRDNQPGLDLKKTVKAPSGEIVTVDVTFGADFFRPFF